MKNYVIEYRDARRTNWMRAGSVPAGTTSFKCANLIEGSDYFFRIIAVNDEGESQPLESKETIKPQREISELHLSLIHTSCDLLNNFNSYF